MKKRTVRLWPNSTLFYFGENDLKIWRKLFNLDIKILAE